MALHSSRLRAPGHRSVRAPTLHREPHWTWHGAAAKRPKALLIGPGTQLTVGEIVPQTKLNYPNTPKQAVYVQEPSFTMFSHLFLQCYHSIAII